MIMQSVSVFTLKWRPWHQRLLISNCDPHRNGDWINGRLDDFGSDDITGLEDVGFDYLVYGIRFYWLPHVVRTILTLPILPAVASLSHLVL